MRKNSDFIKHYAVKIESDFGKQGSGILIKVDEDKYYLATAKHNFTQSLREDAWKDVNKSVLENQLDEIILLKGTHVVKIVSFCDGYDAVVFEVKNNNKEFEKLDKTHILYEDNYGSEYEFFFHGYPQGKIDGSDDTIQELKASNDNCAGVGRMTLE